MARHIGEVMVQRERQYQFHCLLLIFCINDTPDSAAAHGHAIRKYPAFREELIDMQSMDRYSCHYTIGHLGKFQLKEKRGHCCEIVRSITTYRNNVTFPEFFIGLPDRQNPSATHV